MIKNKIKIVSDDCNFKINNLLKQISIIDLQEHYTEAYRQEQKAPLYKEIANLKVEAKNTMLDVFNEKIDGIKSKEIFNFNDIEINNVLKTIEMSITSMRPNEIQHLVDKYSDNPIIFRTIEAQVKKNGIEGIKLPFKTFMPDTKELESMRDNLCNGMNMSESSLFSSLTYEMIMANNDNVF